MVTWSPVAAAALSLSRLRSLPSINSASISLAIELSKSKVDSAASAILFISIPIALAPAAAFIRASGLLFMLRNIVWDALPISSNTALGATAVPFIALSFSVVPPTLAAMSSYEVPVLTANLNNLAAASPDTPIFLVRVPNVVTCLAENPNDVPNASFIWPI